MPPSSMRVTLRPLKCTPWPTASSGCLTVSQSRASDKRAKACAETKTPIRFLLLSAAPYIDR
eukprot:scaffold3795_cov126-Isochrysis_galbana.AAC.1